MNATIELTNIDDAFLRALRGLFEIRPDVGFEIKKDVKSSYEDEILKELKETKEAYKKGEIKAYYSAKELMEDLRREL